MQAQAVGVPTVTVVVVTYDAPGDLLERCLRSVLETTGPGTAASPAFTVDRLVVVDNGGRAAQRLADAGLADDVTLLDPGANDGFAAGVNVGCRAAIDAGADVAVVLNDDVDVTSDWLAPLMAELANDASIAAAQPVLVRQDDESVVESAGVAIDRFGAGSDLGRGDSVDRVPATTRDVEAVTGGAMALRVAALEQLGPFDQRFFLYYEDVEWCWRARAAGWRCVVVPGSVVRHVGSASTFRLGTSLRRLQERNRLWWAAMRLPARTMAGALWLSIRRLRHSPRRVHAHALLGGIAGAAPRLARRVVRRTAPRPSGWSKVAAPRPGAARPRVDGLRDRTSAPAFLRRPLPGLNVAGFHHADNGLGDAVRTLTASLRAAGVDVVEVDNELTDAPQRFAPRPEPADLHDTTIAVVTAVETARFREHHPALFDPGRRVIGYWFWELATVPASHRHAFDLVDEVWTPTTFVREAFAEAADARTAVRHAPLRLPAPLADEARVARWRRDLGDATTFLVSFDYFSIPERKNPQAAIRAFLDAFDGRDDVALIVKSQNSSFRPEYAVSVRALADGDRRIRFLDDHLDEADHLALLAAVDCLVSPHRSEGLGLQPAQAMALETAVISTAYGGVMDYCTHDNAVLVDHRLVGVVDGEGVYPTGTPWADVDHDGLVRAYRSVADDRDLRASLVAAGRRTIVEQPEPERFGRAYVDLATTIDLRRRAIRLD